MFPETRYIEHTHWGFRGKLLPADYEYMRRGNIRIKFNKRQEVCYSINDPTPIVELHVAVEIITCSSEQETWLQLCYSDRVFILRSGMELLNTYAYEEGDMQDDLLDY